MTPTDFRARFAFELIGTEGVLVNLETGGYFHLNPTAAAACVALEEAKDADDAASMLAAELAAPPAEAQTVLSAVVAGIEQEGLREEPPGPFRYRQDGSEYVLEEGGRRKLSIDRTTRTLRLAAPLAELRFSLEDHVRAATPKLLGLLGIKVLHAAACTLANRTVAFSGDSGAGKTTTMRSFVTAGAAPISEDLVVLANDQGVLSLQIDGEWRAHQWAAEAARRLTDDSTLPVSFASLAAITSGPTRELDEIWFIAAQRREGDHFELKRMAPPQGFLALFRQAFLSTADPPSWRGHLKVTRALATRISLFETTTPAGLDSLVRATRDYTTNSASYR